MKHLASAAVAGAVTLGLRDVFRPREPVPIVVDYAGDPPELEPITLFFHPQVPEATLVLVQI
jgi:hypothetical protein